MTTPTLTPEEIVRRRRRRLEEEQLPPSTTLTPEEIVRQRRRVQPTSPGVPAGTPSIGPPVGDFTPLAPGPLKGTSQERLLADLKDLITAPDPGSFLGGAGTPGVLTEALGDAFQIGVLPLDAFGEAVAQAGQALPGPIGFLDRAFAFQDRPISEQISFGLIDPAIPLGIGRAVGSAARSLFRGSRFTGLAPASRVSPAAPTATRPLAQLADAENIVRSRQGVVPTEAVPEQIGTGQVGFGIGEDAAQGRLLSPAAGPEQVPLIDDTELLVQAGRQEEIAGGQLELPEEVLPDILDTRLERANQAMDEATAEFEATFTRGAPAARFGTPEFAAAAEERQRLASEGIPFVPVRARQAASRAARREARAEVKAAEEELVSQPIAEVVEGGLGDILGRFRVLINNPGRALDWEQTLLARRTERGIRASSIQEEVGKLIEEGVTAEEAIGRATQNLEGALPTVGTPFDEMAEPYVREVLFQEVFAQLVDEPFEMRATATALERALRTGSIPSTVGTEGGSSLTRLQRVFGAELTEKLTQGRKLEEVIQAEVRGGLGLTRFQGARRGDPGPVGDVLNLPQPETPRMALGEEFPPFSGIESLTAGEDARRTFFAAGRPDPIPPSGGADIPPGGGVEPRLFAEADDPPVRRTNLDRVREAIGIPRGLLATGEFSAWLRQGGILFRGHPITSSRALIKTFRSMFNEEHFVSGMRQLKQRPDYETNVLNSTLYFADDAAAFAAREEIFATKMLQSVPLLGRVIRGSERAFVHFLNRLRMDVMDDVIRGWEKPNRAGVVQKTTKAERDKLGEFVNHASGRGDLGRLEVIAPELTATFFAPRFAISRFQVLADLIDPRFTRTTNNLTGEVTKQFVVPKRVRMLIAKDLAAFVTINMGVLAMLSKVPGVDVGMNPNSSDFGKVRIGNTRYDFWGGEQQIARLAIKIATGKGFRGRFSGPIGDFLRFKLNPPVGLAVDVAVGADPVGRDISTDPQGLADEAFQRMMPLFIQDMKEAFDEEGLGGLGLALPGAAGVSVQSFEDRKDSRRRSPVFPGVTIR